MNGILGSIVTFTAVSLSVICTCMDAIFCTMGNIDFTCEYTVTGEVAPIQNPMRQQHLTFSQKFWFLMAQENVSINHFKTFLLKKYEAFQPLHCAC